jgi:hypothetical protein
MDNNDQITAAILAAGYASAQRQPLSGGVLEETLKEKYLEFLDFLRQQNGKGASGKAAKKKK